MPGAEPASKRRMVTALLLFGRGAIGAKVSNLPDRLAGSVNRRRHSAEIEIGLNNIGRREPWRWLNAAVEQPVARCGIAIRRRTMDFALAVVPIDHDDIVSGEQAVTEQTNALVVERAPMPTAIFPFEQGEEIGGGLNAHVTRCGLMRPRCALGHNWLEAAPERTPNP